MTGINIENVNLYDIPISALHLTRKIITTQLDPRRLFTTDADDTIAK